MLAAILLVVAAALMWRPVSASPANEFVCHGNARRFDVKADYRSGRSVSVRVANSSFIGQCIVNVTLATSSERWQRERSPLLLLVKVERLRLNSPEDSFYVSMSNHILRTDNYCIAAYCDPTYLWAIQSVELYLYVTSSSKTLASYDADFIVTEATNVCGLANRSGDLLVQNSGSRAYAFASDSRHLQLPPNNVACTVGFEYSLTIRPSVASATLLVSVLACPTGKRCGTLLLNGLSCSDGAKVSSAQPGSNVTLHYVLRSCDDHRQFAGFVVSAVASVFSEPPSTSATVRSRATPASAAITRATTRPTTSLARKTQASSSVRTSSAAIGSSSAAIGATEARAADTSRSLRPPSTTAHSLTDAAIESSSADETAELGLVERAAANEFTVTVVTASVAAVAATALVIGITVALICRRRRLRSPDQEAPARAVLHVRSTASASGEEIAMLDNEMYGVTLASTTTAQQ